MTGAMWRDARIAAGLTLREVARRAGISAPYLSDVEHGRRRVSAETEAKMCAAIGLPPPDPLPVSAGRCVVCGGHLRARTIMHPGVPDPHGVIGPGYRPIMHAWEEDDGFACERCGIRYDALPQLAPTRDPRGGKASTPAPASPGPSVGAPGGPGDGGEA